MKLLVSCMHVKVYVNNIHMVRFPIDIPRGTFMGGNSQGQVIFYLKNP